MKKLFALLLALVVVLSMAACGAAPKTEAPATTAAPAEKVEEAPAETVEE